MFLNSGFRINGLSYSASVWIGDDASSPDRRALDALLASIRPRR